MAFLEDPQVQAAMNWLLEGHAIDPVATLTDGRAVRLVSVQCEEGAVVLQCRTVAWSESAQQATYTKKRQD